MPTPSRDYIRSPHITEIVHVTMVAEIGSTNRAMSRHNQGSSTRRIPLVLSSKLPQGKICL